MFDLMIKNVDPYTVRQIPVLIDLMMDRCEFDEEDHGEMLAGILECCADQLSVPEDETNKRAVYRNTMSDILADCAHHIMAAKRECS